MLYNPPIFALIFLPQAVHFLFSKNCSAPHRLLPHLIISDFPQLSQYS